MAVSVLKTHFLRQKRSKVVYRDYKNFRHEIFRADLDEELSKFDIHTIAIEQFSNIFLEILDNHPPKKSRDICANHSSFINKTLRKAKMKRSHVRNKFLKNKTEESKRAYKTQRNYCVNLFKKKLDKTFFAN